MKTAKRTGKGISIVLLTALIFLDSCNPEAIDFDANDSANVEGETASDAYFSDSEDLSSVTVSSDNATAGGKVNGGARIIIVNDPRLTCATVTILPADNSTILIPRGLLTIDFGTSCTDAHGNVRKGKIRISYSGRRFLPGSSIVTTLDGYELNGVKISGVRTIANASNSTQSDPRFTTTMTDGKITWPDGSSISRDESITREWKLGAAPINNQWYVTGSATGKTRHDSRYSMTITDKLVYKRECAVNNQVYMAVQGIKELVVDNKKMTIDYGNGECDKRVTITIRSKSKVVDLGNN